MIRKLKSGEYRCTHASSTRAHTNGAISVPSIAARRRRSTSARCSTSSAAGDGRRPAAVRATAQRNGFHVTILSPFKYRSVAMREATLVNRK